MDIILNISNVIKRVDGTSILRVSGLFSMCSPLILVGCVLAPVVAQYPVTSASVGVLATTGKGPADHAVSYAKEEDCNTLRVFGDDPICQPYKVAPVKDKSQPDSHGH